MYNLEFLEDLIKPITDYKSPKAYKSIFMAISKHYYHENFHSDILAYYLSYETPKKVFIDWLNENINCNKNKISYHDYKNGEVLREKDRIDITLFNENRNKAIIIENKSNNANDQDRQLYRYYKKLEEKKITVEQICYINKNSNKYPNFTNYETEEEESIKKILTVTQLVGSKSFSENIIRKVIEETDDIRVKALSLEIIKLFNYLINGGINMEDLDLLVKELCKNGNKKKLDEIINAYNDIPKYLAYKYKNYIVDKSTKFHIWIYKDRCLVIDNIYLNKKRFAIDIWFSTEKVDIFYVTRDGNDDDIENFKDKLENKFPFTNKKINNPLDKEATITSTIDKILNALTTLSSENADNS